MSIIDLVVLALLGLGVLIGWYHGTLRSAANVLACLLALAVALAGHGAIAEKVDEKNELIPRMIYYSESDEFLGEVETVRLPVDTLTPEALNDALRDSHLPFPVDYCLRENLASKAFADRGLATLGEYLSMTIAMLTVRIGAFLILFLGVFILLYILIRLLDFTLKFPVLRYGDSVVGSLFGLLTVAFLLFVLCTLIPVGLSFVPFEELRVMIEDSAAGHLFYEANFILSLIKGFI